MKALQKEMRLTMPLPSNLSNQLHMMETALGLITCADINGWSYATKGLYLAVSLRGNAHGVLGNMQRGTKLDFDSLVQALED